MIETVLGPIDPDALGVTSFHDHLASDSSSLRRDGALPAPASDRVGPDTIAYVRDNMLALADNLRLDDDELLVRELAAATDAGHQALVEASSWGLGPGHARLPGISRRSGVAVVSSYGAYIRRTLPARDADLAEDEWEALLVTALVDGVPGTAYRAGILGIMGTTAVFGDEERGMLRAASRAALTGSAAITVRLDPDARNGLEVLGVCTAEGLPADRIVFTNADEFMDAPYWSDLASAGAVIEMCFGTEFGHPDRIENASDLERLDFFAAFCDAHPAARHVLGTSIWTKAHLAAHGGPGYGHLGAVIAPALDARGIPASRVTAMLVDEPRRLLDRG
ncbi:phosphotriesterase [Microbacterium rhizomatis]|uniref:Phosphotriesterase n=1 Tax=Microbacterium rhizomatis TaxID=1631477 RepID=A0A5J5J3P0_9MICO|nr:phosphotriesterase [Microbacterium rhizomatis]KAA9108013.1 phosphotriesterase [Microbacterium rhizomatis]